jgi:hypothetical protein
MRSYLWGSLVLSIYDIGIWNILGCVTTMLSRLRTLLIRTKSCIRCQRCEADETGLCLYCYLDIRLASEATSNFSSDPYVIPDDFNMAHIHPFI